MSFWKSSQIAVQVQGTNDSSIVSKLSSANMGYFQDEFLKYFVKKPCRRSPLINRGYYIRFKAVEFVFNTWIDYIANHTHGSHFQVVSLGAGFDTSYFRLKRSGKLSVSCRYIEIDFPEVLHRKLDCITANRELDLLSENTDTHRDVCFSEIILNTADYVLLGVDMNNLLQLKSAFDALQVNVEVPTLILAECSIAYMDVDKSDDLILWFSKHFQNAAFITYEQVYPSDGFGCIMRNHFISIGSPLMSIERYPDTQSMVARFLNRNWTRCHVICMNEFFNMLPDEEKERIQNLEMFDEYETWHQKCSHYALACATRGCIPTFPAFQACGKSIPRNACLLKSPAWLIRKASSYFQRYGHQMAVVSRENVLMFGGFGLSYRKHQRLKNLILHNFHTNELGEVKVIDPEDVLGNRVHHTIAAIGGGRIVVCGGRSSPSHPYGDVLLLYPVGNSLFCSTPGYSYSCGNMDSEKARETLPAANIAYFVTTKIACKPRWRHSAASVTHNGCEVIMVFGGCTASRKATDDCLLLHTCTWALSEVPRQTCTPSPRHSHSAAANGNHEIIITGGLSSTEQCLNSIHVFDIRNCTWATLNVKGLLPRYSHTSHVWNGNLILVGGVNDLPGPLPFVAIINLKLLTAVEITLPAQETDDIILLHNHSSILLDKTIITVGGGGNCFSFGTHFNQSSIVFEVEQLVSKCIK